MISQPEPLNQNETFNIQHSTPNPEVFGTPVCDPARWKFDIEY